MKMFLSADVVDEGTTPYKLIKLDLPCRTATKILLASSKTSPTQKLEFKEFCSVMLKNTILKLRESMFFFVQWAA